MEVRLWTFPAAKREGEGDETDEGGTGVTIGLVRAPTGLGNHNRPARAWLSRADHKGSVRLGEARAVLKGVNHMRRIETKTGAKKGATVAASRTQMTWRKTFFLLCSMGALVAFFAFAGGASAMRETAATAPSIVSDQVDYTPGSTVTLTGSNWGAGEAVHVFVNDDGTQSWSYSADVTANDSGNFTNQLQLPNWFVDSYTVTATGSFGATATTTFTDGNVTFALATADTVTPTNWTVNWTKYGDTTCTSAQSTGSVTNGLPNVGVGSNKSVKPTSVTAASPSGYAFAYWSDTASSTTPSSDTCTPDSNTPRTLYAHFHLSDATAPTTAAGATLSPGPGTYTFGDWAKQNVAVSLNATDNTGGSGVKEITYSASGAQTIAPTTTSGSSASFSILSDGTTTISFFAKDNAGNVETTQTRTIKIDKTAPAITDLGPTAAPDGTNSWYTVNVTNRFKASDSLSGLNASCQSAFPDVSGERIQSKTTNGEGSSVKVSSDSCTDVAGNTATSIDSAGFKIDKTAPTLAISGKLHGTSTNYVSGSWTNQDVDVSFDCNDTGGSGPKASSVPADETVSATKSYSKTCMDEAGNTSAPATFQVNIDKVAPSISASAKKADTTDYTANTWTNQDVTVTFSCTDSGGSGVASFTGPITFSTNGDSHQANGTCSDNAGNNDSTSFGPVKIDKTAPDLGIADTNAATYNVCGARPIKPGFNPSDALSGLDGSQGESWTTPGTPSGVGSYTYSAHARDNAGNAASYGPKTYTVLYGTAFGGYLQPINGDGSSRFKLGSTIPVKFQALCNGVAVGNVTAKMYVKQGDSQPDPGVDEAISTAASTTGNLFRYDSTAQQYIFNLSTKLGYVNPGPEPPINNFSQGTWSLKIGLDDGTFRSVNIQLVR